MGRLVLRRLLALVPVLLIVSFAVFFLLALVPGNPAITLAGGVTATPAQIAHVTAQLHLNDPLLVQYGRWLGNALHGNLGTSISTGQPVTQQIEQRFPVTFGLVVASAIVSLVVGIPVGLISGIRPQGVVDGGARTFTTLGLAVPSFWLAVLLVSIFAVHWHVFPPTGYTSISTSFTSWLRDITLPAITLGVLVGATLARQLRASLIDTLDTPYIRTAWAKGGTRRTVLFRHGLKNAAMPVVTVFGIQIGYLLGGAVIIEQIFALPGLGPYMLSGITDHDLPVVQGVAVVFVLFQMAMSLLVDISYGYLNPKVRVS
ncbi:MAG TPA: ABC transporter permease [Acidimicrobiales bacterium]|nr:ABC transporter permease [Acidimicrobiales bacterium]